MFLNRLNEEEKVAFLELAHHIARCDNSFSEEEKAIISQYCLEMQIEDIEYDESKFDIYTTLEKFQDKKSQKVVTLEIMALIYADDFLHEDEEKALATIMERFALNQAVMDIYKQWTKSILALTIQGEALLHL